jgi:glycerol uptake facilitator-like aquaporin
MSLALWYYEEEFVKVHIYRRFGYILIIQPFSIFVGQMLSLAIVGPNIIYLHPRDSEPFKIAICEFIWTGVFIFTALHVIVSRYTRPSNQIGVNFIIFVAVLYFCNRAAETISGGSLNPTKYLINQAIAYHRGVEPLAFQNWYCYVFPQFAGTITFTCAFKYLFEPTYLRMMSLKMKWEDKFYPEKYLKEN